MKILIVYYSLDGNCDFIAKQIKEATGAQLLRLQPKKEINAKSATKYLWGGRQVIFKKAPQLQDYDFNAKDFDFIIIGTPVWAWNYTPALRTFFAQNKIKDKDIALICCHGGSPGNTLKNLKNELTANNIIGQVDFYEPLKNNRPESAQKAKDWCQQIIKVKNS